MKKLSLALGASIAVMAAAGAAHAEVTTTGSIGAYSDYRLRGQSLSNFTPVMQGSIEIAADVVPGLKAFAGVWGSSLDKEAGAGALEADLYAGFSGKVGKVDWKGTYLDIRFPDEPIINFKQYAASVSFPLGPLSTTLGAVHDDYDGADATYGYVSLGYTIPDTPISLSATLGHENTDNFWTDKKTNWGLGASYAFQKIKVGIEYIDTDKTLLNASGKNLTGETFLFSLTGGF